MKHLTEIWQMNSYTNEEITRFGLALSGDALIEFERRAIEQAETSKISELEEEIEKLEDALAEKDETIDALQDDLTLLKP